MIKIPFSDFLSDALLKQPLKRDMTADDGYDPHFQCSICLLMVHNPGKCSACEAFFCINCADKHKKKNTFCPTCKHDPLKMSRLNKFEKVKLGETG